MNGRNTTRSLGSLVLAGAFAGLLVAGCSEITPAPDDEAMGEMGTPHDESDGLRQTDERQDHEMEEHAR